MFRHLLKFPKNNVISQEVYLGIARGHIYGAILYSFGSLGWNYAVNYEEGPQIKRICSVAFLTMATGISWPLSYPAMVVGLCAAKYDQQYGLPRFLKALICDDDN